MAKLMLILAAIAVFTLVACGDGGAAELEARVANLETELAVERAEREEETKLAESWTPTSTPQPAPTWTPTPTPQPAPTWTPTPTPAPAHAGRISDDCAFEIRSKMGQSNPMLAQEALRANPAALTDDDRRRWFGALGYWHECRELWSLPAADAPDKRNADWQGACFSELTHSAVSAYREQWLQDGYYFRLPIERQGERYDGGGLQSRQRSEGDQWGEALDGWRYWNGENENPYLLAMAILESENPSEEDALALRRLGQMGDSCGNWRTQLQTEWNGDARFGGLWIPVPPPSPSYTPVPTPSPTPVGYKRDLTTPDEAQIETYQAAR